jgi:hypothetical protein
LPSRGARKTTSPMWKTQASRKTHKIIPGPMFLAIAHKSEKGRFFHCPVCLKVRNVPENPGQGAENHDPD